MGLRLRYHLFTQTPDTLKTKALMQDFERQFDLTPYLFTKSVKIKEGVIPHSHPMLTLNTFWNDSPYHLLSTFIHEECHWFLNWTRQSVYSKVHGELRTLYPTLPSDPTQVASNTYSTYTHLVICWLELQGLKHYIGVSSAHETLSSFKHYTWIFRTVMENEQKIGTILQRHGVVIDIPKKREGSSYKNMRKLA